MNRQHFAATTGKRLAAQYFIADANAQLTFSANMLFQWNNKTPGPRGGGRGGGGG
ncbi:hypothetical protein HMPREF9541_03816, partial [Escherichia coli MS 116-1]